MGQDSLPVTKNFHFADGAYLSMAAWQANRPELPQAEISMEHFTNPQTAVTQVREVRYRGSGQRVPLDSIRVIVLGGVPSVRVSREEISKELPSFAALKLRGKVCYYTYPDWRKRTVAISAYNPLNGRPFRSGRVEREEEVIVEKLLHFETGETADFNLENFLRFISDDPLLVETYAELPAEAQAEKLFKGLLIYVDRNPTYIRR
ncbi:MAG: hypothetical protein RLY31_1513 [Bacteroidota bacterium]